MNDRWQQWRREPLANGGVVLTAPAGADHGSIYIRPGLRPLRPLREIVERFVAPSAGPHAVQRLVTDEGEYAAMIATRDRVVGIVIGDGEYTLVDAASRGAETRATVERLLRSLTLGVAAERARQFPYGPPTSWFGLRGTLASCWAAPDGPARLIVCDAVPLGSLITLTQDLLWPLVAPAEARAEGEILSWQVAGRTWALARRRDSRFLYRLQLQRGTREDLSLLRSVTASMEPIPAPPGATKTTMGFFE